MIMQIEDKKYYTPEEYLDFEVNSEERHEWTFVEYNADEMISLNSIDFKITLVDIYDKVEFHETEVSES